MTETINIELSPEAKSLQKQLRRFPDEFKQAVKRGLTDAVEEVTTRIKSQRLSGKGPFPVEEHRLGQVTGLLHGTTDFEPATVISEGDFATISSSLGTEVPYAAIHEYGFSGTETVRAHLRESRTGKVFQVREHTRTMDMPARAPFHTGVYENLDYIMDTIGNAIQDAINKL